MTSLITFLIYIHIAGGTLALISGVLSIINKKGGKGHRLTGKIFFYAMMVVSASAIIVASTPSHRNVFLLIIGVFSAYLVSSGYRILYLKKLFKGRQKPQLIDWIISVTMLLFGAFFIYSGVSDLLGGENNLGIVLVVFGTIALLMVRRDYNNYIKSPEDKNFWLYQHISRMIAGNISAFTAFLVVNNAILPPLVAWLLPTVVGTPLIFYFVRQFKTKTKRGIDVQELATVRIGSHD